MKCLLQFEEVFCVICVNFIANVSLVKSNSELMSPWNVFWTHRSHSLM